MDQAKLRQIILDQRADFLGSDPGVPRAKLDELADHLQLKQHAIVISGIRRCGKSTLLRQVAKQYFQDEQFFYVNFEDERLLGFEAEDFNEVLEISLELYGEQTCFLIDEIQNVENWELFTRRLLDSGYQFIVTGSNAALLSSELGTRLTGRSIELNLLPFSFTEYLAAKAIEHSVQLTTKKRAELKREFNNYCQEGGLPINFGQTTTTILQNLYRNIVARDIVNRYRVESERVLKDLGLFLINNIGNPISFNKLKQYLNLGHLNTVKNYVSYLESAWIFHLVTIFSTSIKRQQIASKKVYSNDLGFIRALSLNFVEKQGSILENFVFLDLFRLGHEIFYYKTNDDKEVDFFVPELKLLVQVSYSLSDPDTFERELSALNQAMQETDIKQGYLVTYDDEREIELDNGKVKVVAAYTASIFSEFKEGAGARC